MSVAYICVHKCVCVCVCVCVCKRERERERERALDSGRKKTSMYSYNQLLNVGEGYTGTYLVFFIVFKLFQKKK
jgi:hypothetical protein